MYLWWLKDWFIRACESHITTACSMYSLIDDNFDHQVKTFLVGSDFIGDIPLYQKILAALLTGEFCS